MPQDVVRGDVLHKISLGMYQHLMKWIQSFLKKHGRTGLFNDMWKKIPLYSGYTSPNRLYKEISQSTGKEICNLGKVILACFIAALWMSCSLPTTASREQSSAFYKAILCVRFITHFALLAQYRSHTEQTLTYMTHYLEKFHKLNDIFGEFRAFKSSVKEACLKVAVLRLIQQMAARSDIINMFMTSNAAFNKRKQDDAQELVNIYRETLKRTSHFNISKLHLLLHYAN